MRKKIPWGIGDECDQEDWIDACKTGHIKLALIKPLTLGQVYPPENEPRKEIKPAYTGSAEKERTKQQIIVRSNGDTEAPPVTCHHIDGSEEAN
jgi:hypothetical protein